MADTLSLISSNKPSRYESFINILSFWILGLCNNFAYIVMLSAAHDIIENSALHQFHENNTLDKITFHTLRRPQTKYDCNIISTGAILLADILPTFFLKLVAPFCLLGISYNIRIAFVITFGFLSLLIVSVAYTTWENIIGVVFASLGTGLGDYTFLSLASYYNKDILSAWASGTGAAGLFGSLSYAGLISIGFSSQNSLLLMLFIPLLMGFAFFWLLHKPIYTHFTDILTTPIPTKKENMETKKIVGINTETKLKTSSSPSYNTTDQTFTPNKAENIDDHLNTLYPNLSSGGNTKSTPALKKFPPNLPTISVPDNNNNNNNNERVKDETQRKRRPSFLQLISDEDGPLRNRRVSFDFAGRANQIRHLLPYMVPLSIVYFSEYFINQGLFELTYFRNIWLDHASQYRWYLVDYQLGVFISRSSFKIIPMPVLWIFPILQMCNLFLFLANVYFSFIPSIYIVFVLIFFEGFIGGSAYVNTFHKIAYDHEDPETKEFCLGAASLADTMGISLAGFASLPVHNYFCSKKL